MTKTDVECGHTKTTLYPCGVNKSCKMITYFHLNSSNFNDNFKDNFMQEKVKSIGRINPIICVILVVSSSLRLGALSNFFLMTSLTSLLVAPLDCNAASKLNYWWDS